MYDYFTVHGERATGIEPTASLQEALHNAEEFGLIVHDTELKLDVYDIRKTTKWNPKWLAKRIGNPETKN